MKTICYLTLALACGKRRHPRALMKMIDNLIYAYLDWTMRKIPAPRNTLNDKTLHIMSPLAPMIVRISKEEVGIEEVNGTNCGPRVNEYKAATNLPATESWPWCAAFVDWVVAEAMAIGLAEGKKYSFNRPKTAGAWDLENWSLAQDASTQTRRKPERDIQAGDIVIFTFSHVGIAIGVPDHSGYVPTIEGNTDSDGSRDGGGVFRKHRHISKIRSRIRFTV